MAKCTCGKKLVTHAELGACQCEECYQADCKELINSIPPTKTEIAQRLRKLADEMDEIAVAMDYYGGLAGWSQHGREIAGSGKIARQWAEEIDKEGK